MLSGRQHRDQTPVQAFAAKPPTAPDKTALNAVAENLDQVIAHGDPGRDRALLATLVAELRINSCSEVLPIYRVGALGWRGQSHWVGCPGCRDVCSLPTALTSRTSDDEPSS